MNVSHPALAGFDDMQRRRPAPVMSAGDLAELSREEHRAKFKHTKLCSFYQKGQCTRTFDACAFLHTDDPEVIARLGGVPANAPNPHARPAHADPHVNPRVNSLTGRPRPRFPPGSRIMGIGVSKKDDHSEIETKRTVCRFFASGMCEYGKDCRFLHVVPEPQDRAQPSPKSNTNALCRNFPGCSYGDRCDFKHELTTQSPRDSPFSTASALPPSVSARPSPAVVSRPLEPTPSLGERLGLLGERAGSSVVGERPRRQHELARTASFGELPRRDMGLLEERRSSLLATSLTRGASYGPESSAPSPLARSSSLNLALGDRFGLGLERAHASQPHTRTHTPIPRAPSPSPTHIGIPPSRITPHPATILAPSSLASSSLGSSFPSNGLGLGSSFASNGLGSSFTSNGLGTNGTPTAPGTPIRTLPPPSNEYSGTGWRVASPLPPHLASEVALSAPGSPLALAPGSPLANAFGDGFFPAVPPAAPERKSSALSATGLGLGASTLSGGLGLSGMDDLESDGEGDVLPVVSYEDFADGFGTDHEHDHEHEHEHDHEHEHGSEQREDKSEEKEERPRGYKTLPCKFFNPLLGRECPAGDECNFIHDKLFSNGATVPVVKDKESSHPLFRTRECKYWAAGRCNQGDECPFKHTYGDDVEHFESVNGERENPFWRTRPCKWFQQGQCLRGDSCNYLHTLDTAAPVVCKFYPTPGCRNGNECPFVHNDGEYDMSSNSGYENGSYEHGVYGGENGLYGNGGENGTYGEYRGSGDDYKLATDDDDSEDDVIFEPMREVPGASTAQTPGGLSMLLSGLALNGHAQAQAQTRTQVN